MFFLTGGTALSRGYFNHRYSDDLDFFTVNDPDFKSQTNMVMSALQSSGYKILSENLIISEFFTSIYVESDKYPDVSLKIDFVNDTAKQFGRIVETDLYYKTDDWINILSNKLCALLRLEVKDFTDIWIISKNRSFNWDQILNDAREKEMGLDPAILADLFISIPQEGFDAVRWVTPVSWDQFKLDLDIIVFEMLRGEDNSLYIPRKD